LNTVTLVFIILLYFPNVFSLSNQMYPNQYCTIHLLGFDQLSHFRFLACHSLQPFNNSSCSINNIPYQHFTVLQNILHFPLSLSGSHSAAVFAAFLGLLMAFSQNLPLVPSIIYHPLLTPHNSTPSNVLYTQIISYILRICQHSHIHTEYSDQTTVSSS